MFNTRYKVVFADADPGGIVFFANLFKIAHIGYERFIESFKLEKNYFTDDEFAIPIINSCADFISPVKFQDDLNCSITVTKIGKTSFTLNYKLTVDEILKAEIQMTHVFVKKMDLKKTEIPNDLLSKLKSHLD